MSASNGGLPPANGANSDVTEQGLSADEIALYDRQIRLWGAQAQQRIRSARILLVSLRALGTEIAKNLTLAGINTLTIIDEDPVTEEDLGAQYFVREEDIGNARAQSAIPRIQELNPRVNVRSGGSLTELLTKDQTYYAAFDCVIACDHDCLTLSTINTAAHVAKVPFYAAGIHGFYGYIFADLVGHEFTVERDKSNMPTKTGEETKTRSILEVMSKRDNSGKTIEVVKKLEKYCPLILANIAPLPSDVLSNRRKLRAVPALLPCLRALFDFQRSFGRLPSHSAQDLATYSTIAKDKTQELNLPSETLTSDFLRSFLHNLGAEIVPTAAFVGGRLSEDVINVLGKREQPIQNFALFDGEALEGKTYSLYRPPPEEVGMAAPTADSVNGIATIGNGAGISMQQMSGQMPQGGNMNGLPGMAMGMDGVNGMNGMSSMNGTALIMNGSTMPTLGMDMSDATMDAGMMDLSAQDAMAQGMPPTGPTSAPANTGDSNTLPPTSAPTNES